MLRYLIFSLGLVQVLGSNTLDFLKGLAIGYSGERDESGDCTSSITSSVADWQTFLDSIPTSKGSGNALYQLHDYTLSLTSALTACNMIQLANNLDSSLSENLLANLIRFVANYQSINDEYKIMTTSISGGDYTDAGESMGVIFNYILG